MKKFWKICKAYFALQKFSFDMEAEFGNAKTFDFIQDYAWDHRISLEDAMGEVKTIFQELVQNVGVEQVRKSRYRNYREEDALWFTKSGYYAKVWWNPATKQPVVDFHLSDR